MSLSGVDRSRYLLPPRLDTGGVDGAPVFVRLVDV